MSQLNETLELMQTRRSVRDFKPDMVPEDILDKIIEAGLWAANGRNRQSPIIIKVTDKSVRDRLSRLNAEIMGTDSDPFYGAPAVLIVLADKSEPTYLYDGSLVMGNLMLAAHSLGIGSCWIHRAKEEFESEEGKALLKKWGIEGDYEGIGHCVLGYAAAELPDIELNIACNKVVLPVPLSPCIIVIFLFNVNLYSLSLSYILNLTCPFINHHLAKTTLVPESYLLQLNY